jgi:hypothetical protein
MNGLPSGTIVKVSNPANNKVIYAKVLGELPAMKQSEGLLLRLSNAAVAELGVEVEKFNVQVAYNK